MTVLNEEIREYTHRLLTRFITLFPNSYREMVNTDHNNLEFASPNNSEGSWFSPYHIEGSIWTHTMMCLSHVRPLCHENPRWKELIMTMLLHDIGKPMARRPHPTIENRFIFQGHSGPSTLLSVRKIQELDPQLTAESVIHILRLINYHQCLFSFSRADIEERFNDDHLYSDLLLVRKADYYGNLSIKGELFSSEGIRPSAKAKDISGSDKIIYMMVGIPASGKDTYVKTHFEGLEVSSRDDILLSLAGHNEYIRAFDEADQKKVDKLYNEKFMELLRGKENFVVNRTNLTYKGRRRIINAATQSGFNVHMVVILTDLDECIRRNYNRGVERRHNHVLLEHIKRFEMPYNNESNNITYILD